MVKRKQTRVIFKVFGKDVGWISVDNREPPEAMVEAGKLSMTVLAVEQKTAASL